MQANDGQGRVVLRTWVEDDLAAWVKAQAVSQDRTTSGWLRFVLVRLRAEMAHDPALARTLGGGGSDPT